MLLSEMDRQECLSYIVMVHRNTDTIFTLLRQTPDGCRWGAMIWMSALAGGFLFVITFWAIFANFSV